MKTNWKVTLAAMAVVGMVGLQPQIVLGQDTSGNTVNKQVESVVTEQDAGENAVNKKAGSITTEHGAVEKKIEPAEQGKTV